MNTAKIVELVLSSCIAPILHGNDLIIPSAFFTQGLNVPSIDFETLTVKK